MTAIDLVRELNSLFERHDFTSLRDALEGSEADAISSGFAGADALVRESLADRVVVEFHGATELPEGRRYVGLDAYLKLWRQWLAAFDEYQLEHSGYEEVGEPGAGAGRRALGHRIASGRCDSRNGRRWATTTWSSSATRCRGS